MAQTSLGICTVSPEPSHTGLLSAVDNLSDYRYLSGCRSRGREFDPGPAHTLVEIDHKLISTAILLPFPDSRRVVVSYKGKYMHKVLVNCLVKLAQEKMRLG